MDATTEQLRTLAAVLDHGTFDRAAAALHVTSSAISQRIKALEQQTGRVLLIRTKPVRPTTSGSVVVRLARQVALLESEAMDELGLEGAGARPRIPLVINADSLATWVLPALTGVERASFEITVDDQDHSIERLREGTAMAAITSDSEPVQGCTVRPLGVMRYRAVASRAFVKKWLRLGLATKCFLRRPWWSSTARMRSKTATWRAGWSQGQSTRHGISFPRPRISCGRSNSGWAGACCPTFSPGPFWTQVPSPSWTAKGMWTFRCIGSSGPSNRRRLNV
jgi:ArgP family transcriptional regulator